jgi:hypothetical protein
MNEKGLILITHGRKQMVFPCTISFECAGCLFKGESSSGTALHIVVETDHLLGLTFFQSERGNQTEREINKKRTTVATF